MTSSQGTGLLKWAVDHHVVFEGSKVALLCCVGPTTSTNLHIMTQPVQRTVQAICFALVHFTSVWWILDAHEDMRQLVILCTVTQITSCMRRPFQSESTDST